MLRGSGIAGLAAMARESERDGLVLARPFLDISKSQLIATLRKAKVGFAEDPTNRDTSFTRPRLRTLMPVLAAEGGDTRNLVRLASRLARANAAVEVLVDDAGRLDAKTFDAKAFAAMPDEIRLRLLQRVIDRIGREGPAELGKVEALLSALDLAGAENNAGRRPRLKQTLAGALISLIDSRIRIEPAPPRRRSG
jgi:tRNA(Ile)-lysidine synthase